VTAQALVLLATLALLASILCAACAVSEVVRAVLRWRTARRDAALYRRLTDGGGW